MKLNSRNYTKKDKLIKNNIDSALLFIKTMIISNKYSI